MRQGWFAAAMAVAAVLAERPVHAQRAAENAVNAAEDAFGVSVGNESVGLYTSSSARGFNPAQAGNIRLDGLYFDEPNTTQGRTYADTTMRVGLSAQSYPFPAPTGIVDMRLRKPGDHLSGSGSITYGPFSDTVQVEAEMATPIVPDKLNGLLELSANTTEGDVGWHVRSMIYGGVLTWKPSDTVDVVVFDQGHFGSGQLPALIFTAGGAIPPSYDQSIYVGQPWASRRRTTNHFGLMVSARILDEWLLRAGVFRANQHWPVEYATIFRNVQPDGTGNVDILRTVDVDDLSYSGEVRLSRTFTEGPRQHTLHFAVRGRNAEHLFGGGSTVSYASMKLGVSDPRPEPVFPTPAPKAHNQLSQYTPGISYVGRWRDVGEISVGLQKSFFNGEVTVPGVTPTRNEAQPWLYNGTLAIYLGKDAALYGSYTRGLEESGIAPEVASNRGEALPVSLTEQIDAGIRYRLGAGITMIAGVFEVKKPYFDRNAANLFTEVGDLSHRGAEFSLSGRLAPGLTVVAGAMLLRPRIEANAAVASFIGPVPVGRVNRNVRFNVQYGPAAWKGFSVDGQVNQDGPAYANRANTLQLHANTTLDLGVRYLFKVFDTSASFRGRVQNVTNALGWTVAASGSYAPTSRRRFSAQLVTDF